MKDEFNRDIEYLKISLNNTCNLRCAYCMPYRCENDIEQTRNRFMSTEDYKFIIKSMADFGIKKIEFTGGEPLLNSDLVELVHYAKNTCNIEEVIVSTNGIKFFEEALKLKNAGLDKVNIGINSLKEYKYDSVTRGGNLGNVLKSFSTALKLNIDTTVEMLVMNNFNYEKDLTEAELEGKKVENFEEIKKIEQQFEMGIITKEEKDEKINAILNA